MFVVYILYSDGLNKYYVGHTQDITDRLQRHNQGRSKATKSGIPWKVVYKEVCKTKSEAYNRELYIKKQKSRVYIENLIKKTA